MGITRAMFVASVVRINAAKLQLRATTRVFAEPTPKTKVEADPMLVLTQHGRSGDGLARNTWATDQKWRFEHRKAKRTDRGRNLKSPTEGFVGCGTYTRHFPDGHYAHPYVQIPVCRQPALIRTAYRKPKAAKNARSGLSRSIDWGISHWVPTPEPSEPVFYAGDWDHEHEWDDPFEFKFDWDAIEFWSDEVQFLADDINDLRWCNRFSMTYEAHQLYERDLLQVQTEHAWAQHRLNELRGV